MAVALRQMSVRVDCTDFVTFAIGICKTYSACQQSA